MHGSYTIAHNRLLWGDNMWPTSIGFILNSRQLAWLSFDCCSSIGAEHNRFQRLTAIQKGREKTVL